MGLVACGGDDGGDDDDTQTVDPNGTNHTFVVSKVLLPTDQATSMALGLDIDGKANDGVDNQLGNLLVTIAGLASGLNIQASLDESVDQGSIILLANVKATDLTNGPRSGLWVYQGATPTPAACTDETDTTCRHHLDGNGMFTIKPNTQTDAFLVGNIMTGKFSGGPGNITLQIALSEGAPIDLPLKKARAEVVVSDNGFAMNSKIGGAITQTDIDTKVIPAIQTTVSGLIDRDCPPPRSGTTCGCTVEGSTGDQVLGFLDSNHDCNVSVEEVKGLIGSVLTPDIDLDEDGTNDAVSLGVGVNAVKGTFTVP